MGWSTKGNYYTIPKRTTNSRVRIKKHKKDTLMNNCLEIDYADIPDLIRLLKNTQIVIARQMKG